MIHAIAGPDRDAGIERLMQTPLPAAEEPTENNNCVCHPSNPDAPICLLESIRPAASCSKNDDITDDCSWCSAFEGEACEGAYVEDLWTPHKGSAKLVHRCKLLNDMTTCVVDHALMECEQEKEVPVAMEVAAPGTKGQVCQFVLAYLGRCRFPRVRQRPWARRLPQGRQRRWWHRRCRDRTRRLRHAPNFGTRLALLALLCWTYG